MAKNSSASLRQTPHGSDTRQQSQQSFDATSVNAKSVDATEDRSAGRNDLCGW